MMKITELSNCPDLTDAAINYFWKCWGRESNFNFYQDCMLHSLHTKNTLPKFYIGLMDGEIIGSYALLTNDLVSRQDLMPWFACLHVNETHRNKGYAGRLLNHALKEAEQMGFDKVYLSTDLNGFYEKKGWQHKCMVYNLFGEKYKVYEKEVINENISK